LSSSALPGTKRPRFLARGILFPLRRDGKGDFANGTGEELAISKVTFVLGTNPGEVEWDRAFGCNLRRARHKNDTDLRRALMRVSVIDAFVRYLPTYDLIDVQFRSEGGTLYADVVFNERTGNGARFANDLVATVPTE
jgi:phage baseplate assembly protein W